MTTTLPCVVGTNAPSFQLPAVTPDLRHVQIQSADYHGRWLALLFYPRDFSFVCPTELTGFSAEKSLFDQRNCELLGISIDTIDSHVAWLQTPGGEGGVAGLQFPLASDLQGQLCKQFGIWREQDQLPNRGLFLIDPSGLLRYAASYDLSVGRNVEDVLRALDALQAGGVCPANWKRADGLLDIAALLQPGRVLGHYRIERELGRGAFGQVLAAEDLRLQRRVALKVISKQDGQTEAKLLREARSAAGINHPNVCTVYSADTIDTLPTIVMEYLTGRPLVDVIGQGFDQRNFRRMAQKIALGLAAAHAKGVVHGDLKPANILLRGANDPVLVDFGLAQSLRQTETNPKPTTEATTVNRNSPPSADETLEFAEATATASHAGGISGTPAYMSPEQANGDPLQPSSDIFSLGLIFTQMLTGSAPMSDLSAIEIITSLPRTDFVESLVEKIPHAYRADLIDMLAMNPAERPSAGDVCQRMG